MFGIGFFELLIIVVVILILFGPKKLPELMRQVAVFVFKTKQTMEDTKISIEEAVWSLEKKESDIKKSEISQK